MDEKIVYIIIAAIWIVSSILKAVNKNAKKKNPQQTTNPKNEDNSEKLDDFKKILEEMIIGKQPEIPSPQTVEDYQEYSEYSSENVATAEQTKYAAYQGKTDYNFENYTNYELNNDFEKAKRNNEVQSEDYNVNSIHGTLGKDSDLTSNNKFFDDNFDLKKAVIYSEILKRPHY